MWVSIPVYPLNRLTLGFGMLICEVAIKLTSYGWIVRCNKEKKYVTDSTQPVIVTLNLQSPRLNNYSFKSPSYRRDSW